MQVGEWRKGEGDRKVRKRRVGKSEKEENDFNVD